jgi:predicted Rossmann-fold nucleotide-binding protein
MGDLPFHIANTDKELEHHLRVTKDVKQRAPRIDTSMASATLRKQALPELVPHDGIFTVFVGGGHANNSKRDMEDATAFGYYCASQGWRIVTGAGSVEGSMGAIHTGFIQYHLDRLQTENVLGDFKTTLDLQYKLGSSDEYDAEKLILQNPNLIEQMANQNLIPRIMFYGYSMKPLLEMESPSGAQPPGITYFDAGNRARRLQGLLAPGTKIFLPGSIGTDEEFEETVKQHLEAKNKKKETGATNDIAFSDGTPDQDGKMIIFNRNGHLDKLLAHYKLFGDDAVTKANRRIHNVEVVTSLEDLKKATESRGTSWLERARGSAGSGPAKVA